MEQNRDPVVKMEEAKLAMERSDPGGRSRDSPAAISAPQEGMFIHSSFHPRAYMTSLYRERSLKRRLAARNNTIRTLKKHIQQKDARSAFLRVNSSAITDRDAMMRHQEQATIDRLAEEMAQIKPRVSRLELLEEERARFQNALAEASRSAERSEEKRVQEEISHQDIVEEFQRRIKDLKGQIKSLDKQLASQKAQNIGDRTLANDGKVPDDEIRSLWQQMRFNIQNIVANFLTGLPTPESLCHEHINASCAVCQLTPQGWDYLSDEDMRDSFLQGMIWTAVCGYTFEDVRRDQSATIWGGVAGNAFSKLFRLLYAQTAGSNPAAVLQWKSESARLIDHLVGISEEVMPEVVFDEYKGLSKFLPGNNRRLKDEFYKELGKVFEDAAHLHATFMKSRAFFYIDWARKPASAGSVPHYDPEHHNAEAWVHDLNDESIVLFNISPGLVKVGNADGDSYDKHTRLVKASVVCD